MRTLDAVTLLPRAGLRVGRDVLGAAPAAAVDLWWATRRLLADAPVHRAMRCAHFAGQRLRRGWSDADTWSLDHHLCLTLAGQLEHLAAHTHTRPATFTDEGWSTALLQAAAGLRRWPDRDRSGAALALDELTEHTSPDARADLLATWQADDAARLADAQASLRWIADHLADLWD